MWAVPAALACLAIAGCGSSTAEVAKTAAEQGRPCEAAGLAQGLTAAETAKYERECTAEKNRNAATKEATAVDEAIREGERLKSEGKTP